MGLEGPDPDDAMTGNHRFIQLYVDGGVIGPNDHRSRGVYWSLYDADTGETVRRQERDSLHRTNNDAEWLAVREALLYASEHYPGQPLVIYSDSRVIVKQFQGEYEVRLPRHVALYAECHRRARTFPFVVVKHPERPTLEEARDLLIKAGVPDPTQKQCQERRNRWRPREVMVEKLGH